LFDSIVFFNPLEDGLEHMRDLGGLPVLVTQFVCQDETKSDEKDQCDHEQRPGFFETQGLISFFMARIWTSSLFFH